jgi:hypothetical protein
MLEWLVAITLTGGLPDATRPPACEPDSAARAALKAALRTFASAFERADAAMLDTLLTLDYVHTNGATGVVLDKARWLEYVRSRRTEIQRGRLRLDRYEASTTSIQWYPTLAVVSGRVVAEERRDGDPFTTRVQVTQVWIRDAGQWRRAAFHDSPIPGP